MNVDLAGVSVCIGMPVYGRIPPHTTMSLAHTAKACGAGGLALSIIMESRGIVHWARDAVLDSFLTGTAQKLFWIDADMSWEPGAFLRLLALSTLRDVVSASYPSRTDTPTFQINGTGALEASDELGLVRVKGLGLGFTVMDRKVCEAVALKAPISHDDISGRDLHDVFRFDVKNGTRRGEDILFFEDINALGFDVWLDPSITLGHVGDKMWTGRAADHLQKENTNA